jgi:hypothetical protein
MIGKVPYGVAGTSPFLAIGIFLITEFPALGAEASALAPCSITVTADAGETR